MLSINSLVIDGKVLTDPLLRHTPKGTAVCTFRITHERFYSGGDGREVSYFNIEARGKLAENIYRLGTKGRRVRVLGRIKQDRWIGVDGKEKEKVAVVVEDCEFRPEETSTRSKKKGNNDV